MRVHCMEKQQKENKVTKKAEFQYIHAWFSLAGSTQLPSLTKVYTEREGF